MSTVATPVSRSDAEPLWFLHNLARILVDGRSSEGRLSVVEATGAPGDMPPLHIHLVEDETFWVLDGELEVHIAGCDPVVVRQGQAAFAPRGLAHVYRVSSPGPARWLAVTSGGGFAAFVAEVSVPAGSPALPLDAEFDPAEIAQISARHGIEIVAPPGTLP